MNKVTLTGNIVRAVELKKGKTKSYIGNAIAAAASYKDSSGAWKQKKAQFIPFTIWDKYAEIMADKIKKGDLVKINGELHENKDKLELYVNSILKITKKS